MCSGEAIGLGLYKTFFLKDRPDCSKIIEQSGLFLCLNSFKERDYGFDNFYSTK
jgi:hypothetical protein